MHESPHPLRHITIRVQRYNVARPVRVCAHAEATKVKIEEAKRGAQARVKYLTKAGKACVENIAPTSTSLTCAAGAAGETDQRVR